MLTALLTLWTLLILTTGFSVYDQLNFKLPWFGGRRSSAHLLHCLWLGLLMGALCSGVLYSLAWACQYLANGCYEPLLATLNGHLNTHGLTRVFLPLSPLFVVWLSVSLVIAFLAAPWIGTLARRRYLF
ncbi:hypothetical protein [Pseudomonas moorei]|uniref:hypothetical protein n=1 Tax=Pseudomonas moorei TaxID=395599 RepID=UPI001FF63454|nr:hypothetical protein [Pseudomonas moorei]